MSPEHDAGAGETSASGDQDPDAGTPRQRIVKVAGSRRVRLTPAPGAQEEPVETDDAAEDAASVTGQTTTADRPGPNDERMRRDVPPHW